MKHLDIRIFGLVQGVSFRWYAKEKARELGLTGFARNDSDGSVYIEVEGDEELLKKFVEWCRSGPKFAGVEKVEADSGELKNFGTFTY